MQLSFHPRVWLNPIISAMWSIEKEMFLAAIALEETALASLLNSQVTQFNFAARYERGREVFFYRVEMGIFDSDQGPKIDVSQREAPWVEFTLKLRSGANIKAKFYLIDGTACYIRYSAKANRHMVRGATITKIKRFSCDEEAMAERDPISLLGLTEQLESLSREPVLGLGFPRFMSPKEAYEIVLAQGDFIAIGELPDEGMILVHSGSGLQGDGIYIGLYGQEAVEFVSTDLMEASDKLKLRATASARPS